MQSPLGILNKNCGELAGTLVRVKGFKNGQYFVEPEKGWTFGGGAKVGTCPPQNILIVAPDSETVESGKDKEDGEKKE